MFLFFDNNQNVLFADKILLLNKDNGLAVDEEAISALLGKCDAASECSPADLALLERLLEWPNGN